MNNSTITTIVVMVIGAFVAVWVGVSVANTPIEVAVGILVALILIASIKLGPASWMLIPISSALAFKFYWIPGIGTPLLVSIVLVGAIGALALLARRLKLIFRVSLLEISLVVLILSILQSWIRNPVGLMVFETSLVGGRIYYELILQLLATVMLMGLRVPVKHVQTAAICSLVAGIVSTGIGAVAFFIAPLAYSLGPILGTVGQSDFWSPDGPSKVEYNPAGRNEPLREFAFSLNKALPYFVSPLKVFLHPFWLFVGLTIAASVCLGGYRAAIPMVAMNCVLGVFYRQGIVGFAGALVAAVVLWIVLVIGNSIAPYPAEMQRALGFLPGNWERKYRDAGSDSTEWRIEMWKSALMTDRYIHNKIFGDGLGIPKEALIAQTRLKHLNQSGFGLWDEAREFHMIAGNYHNGAVHTIRVSGYVGLLITIWCFGLVALRASRFIRRAKGTPWFAPALFFCISMVWHPIYFFILVGFFNLDVPILFLNYGILRLLENSFDNVTESVAAGIPPSYSYRVAP